MLFPSAWAEDVVEVAVPSEVVSGVVPAAVSKRKEYPAMPLPASVAAAQETSMVVSVLQVEVAWKEEVRLETVEGAVVSIKAEPLLEYAELLETASVANALKYQVPSANDVECV